MKKRGEGKGIGRMEIEKEIEDWRSDVESMGEEVVNILGRESGEELEEKRKIVWKLIGVDIEEVIIINMEEIENGMKEVEDLEMEMIEKVKRKRESEVKEMKVELMRIVEIGGEDIIEKIIEKNEKEGGEIFIKIKRRFKIWKKRMKLRRGVGEEKRNDIKG